MKTDGFLARKTPLWADGQAVEAEAAAPRVTARAHGFDDAQMGRLAPAMSESRKLGPRIGDQLGRTDGRRAQISVLLAEMPLRQGRGSTVVQRRGELVCKAIDAPTSH